MTTDLAQSRICDARTGIVRRLERRRIPEQFPSSFSLTHAVLSDTTAFSRWPSDSSGAGYAFSDPAGEVGAALGEAVERYCGNLVCGPLRTASWSVLTAAGEPALDPTSLALFSERQHRSGRLPVGRFDRDTVVDWAPAVRVCDGASILVPASLLWVSHAIHSRPLLHPVIQAGLAAGPTRERAKWGALCEVIERDAMTLAWTGGRGVRELRPPDWLRRFATGPHGALHSRWFAFPEEFGIPVIGALVTDRATGYLTLGMGVAPDPVQAAVKAFGEALQLQLFCADYDDPEGAYMRIAANVRSPLKPWRPERDYGCTYREDLADAVDYGCHLQLHLDPAVQFAFLRELEPAISGVQDLESLAGEHTPGDFCDLARAVEARGLSVLCADLTTPDVKAAGYTVVRVVVPGTYSNSPFALPFLGGDRLGVPVARPVPLPH